MIKEKPKRGRPKKEKVPKVPLTPKQKAARNKRKKKDIARLKKQAKEAKLSGAQPENTNTEKFTEDIALALGKDVIRWMKEKPVNMFYKEYLCMLHDYDPDTLTYLAKKFDSFSVLKKRIETIQELKLQKYANSKMIHPTIAIFSLKNNHGYTDRQDVTTGGDKLDRKIEIEILKND